MFILSKMIHMLFWAVRGTQPQNKPYGNDRACIVKMALSFERSIVSSSLFAIFFVIMFALIQSHIGYLK